MYITSISNTSTAASHMWKEYLQLVVRFQVSTAATMKNAAFLDIMPRASY
jgi:hypothetical protein